MKVLLIEPPKTCWELMGEKNVSPPLGLAQIAGVLENRGIDVEVVDCNAFELDWNNLEDKIEKIRPSVVGSTAITSLYYKSIEVMKIAKRVDEKIFTVMGAPSDFHHRRDFTEPRSGCDSEGRRRDHVSGADQVSGEKR